MLISFIINCLIAAMVLFAFTAMFLGWNFMGKAGKLDSPGLDMLRYFTIDSNVLMGICSLIMAGAELMVLLGKWESLPACIYVIKLMGASSVLLTFVVTVCFLRPQFKDPLALYYNSNLFFHLLVPLAGAGSFVFAERSALLPVSAVLPGALPTFVYAMYYMVSVLTHLKDGKPDKHYDFYNFLNGDLKRAPAALVIILTAACLLSLLLWLGNRAGL